MLPTLTGCRSPKCYLPWIYWLPDYHSPKSVHVSGMNALIGCRLTKFYQIIITKYRCPQLTGLTGCCFHNLLACASCRSLHPILYPLIKPLHTLILTYHGILAYFKCTRQYEQVMNDALGMCDWPLILSIYFLMLHAPYFIKMVPRVSSVNI